MPLFCHEFKKQANKPKPQKLCLSWTPRILIPNPYPETAVGLWLMWSNGLKMSVFLSNWSPDKFWTDILSVLQDQIDRDNRKKNLCFIHVLWMVSLKAILSWTRGICMKHAVGLLISEHTNTILFNYCSILDCSLPFLY